MNSLYVSGFPNPEVLLFKRKKFNEHFFYMLDHRRAEIPMNLDVSYTYTADN
jgi:hypothetical protein